MNQLKGLFGITGGLILYPGFPILGILFMALLTTAIGIYINELTLHYRSALLAGWIHGVFNSQLYGIWRSLLFAGATPFLGGIPGLVGIVVISVLGIITMQWFKRTEPGLPPESGWEHQVFPSARILDAIG